MQLSSFTLHQVQSISLAMGRKTHTIILRVTTSGCDKESHNMKADAYSVFLSRFLDTRTSAVICNFALEQHQTHTQMTFNIRHIQATYGLHKFCMQIWLAFSNFHNHCQASSSARPSWRVITKPSNTLFIDIIRIVCNSHRGKII